MSEPYYILKLLLLAVLGGCDDNTDDRGASISWRFDTTFRPNCLGEHNETDFMAPIGGLSSGKFPFVNVDLQAGCMPCSPTPEVPCKPSVRIGLSVSMRTMFDLGSLKTALAFSHVFSETQIGQKALRFCLCDDMGQADNATRIYQEMLRAPDELHGELANTHQMDIVFGPSNMQFGETLAIMADAKSVLMFLWAFNESSWNTFPLSGEQAPDLTVVNQVKQISQLQLLGNLSGGVVADRRLEVNQTAASSSFVSKRVDFKLEVQGLYYAKLAKDASKLALFEKIVKDTIVTSLDGLCNASLVSAWSLTGPTIDVFVQVTEPEDIDNQGKVYDMFANALWWSSFQATLASNLQGQVTTGGGALSVKRSSPAMNTSTITCPSGYNADKLLLLSCGAGEERSVHTVLNLSSGASHEVPLPLGIQDFKISISANGDVDLKLMDGPLLIVAHVFAQITTDRPKSQWLGMTIEFSGDKAWTNAETITITGKVPVSDMKLQISDALGGYRAHPLIAEATYSYRLAECPEVPYGCKIVPTTTPAPFVTPPSCWERYSLCPEQWRYGFQNLTNCTSLGMADQSVGWCSLDSVYQGNWKYCRNVCTQGPSSCPFGYEQTGLRVYTCGNTNDTISVDVPGIGEAPRKVLDIPANVTNFFLQVVATTLDFDLMVWDPSHSEKVVQKYTGIVNKFLPTATYLGSEITYTEIGNATVAYNKTVTISEKVAHDMSLFLSSSAATGFQALLTFSTDGFALPCPTVPAGCSELQQSTTTTTAATSTTTTTIWWGIQCPEGYFRTQPVIIGCAPDVGEGHLWFRVPPAGSSAGSTLTTDVFQIPVGVTDFQVVIESANYDVDLVVYYPGFSTAIVEGKNPSSVFNDANKGGTHEGMVWFFTGSRDVPPISEGVTTRGVCAREMQLRIITKYAAGLHEDVEVKFKFAHAGFQLKAQCSDVPIGCEAFNASALANVVASWSERIRLIFTSGPEEAWKSPLFQAEDTVTNAGLSLGVAWHEFEAIWKSGLVSEYRDRIVDWKAVFKWFDLNNNGYLSYAELEPMYAYTVTHAVDPDGHLWNIGLHTVFDINLPPSRLAIGSLQQLKFAGAKHILAVAETNDKGVPWRDRCKVSLDYAGSIGFTPHAVDVAPLSFTTLAADLASLTLDIDVLLLCASQELTVYIIMMLSVFNVNPKAVLLSTPWSPFLSPKMEGVKINGVMEPLPWSLPSAAKLDFAPENMATCFLMAKEWVTELGSELSVTSTQLLAAITVVAAAYKNVSSGNKNQISNFLRSRAINTCWGDILFDYKGKRTPVGPAVIRDVSFAGTRQFKPLQAEKNPSVESRTKRAFASRLHVVRSNFSKESALPWRGRDAPTHLDYPGKTYLNKARAVFHCNIGCESRNLQCSPCKPGFSRQADDLLCVACKSGKYSDQIGLEQCKSCPKGAECVKRPAGVNSTPVSLPGYFRVDNTEDTYGTTPATDNDLMQTYVSLRHEGYISMSGAAADLTHIESDEKLHSKLSDKICDLGPARERYAFFKCSPTSICLGNNQCPPGNFGMYCASCEKGYSYYGLFRSQRKCKKCPSQPVCMFQGFAILCFYLGIFAVLSHLFAKAAVHQRSISAAVLRNLVSHLHLLSAVAESVDLGSISSLFNWFPGDVADVLVSPYMVFKFDCFWRTTNRLGLYKTMLFAATLVPVGGSGVIIVFHLFVVLKRELRFQIACSELKRQARAAGAAKSAKLKKLQDKPKLSLSSTAIDRKQTGDYQEVTKAKKNKKEETKAQVRKKMEANAALASQEVERDASTEKPFVSQQRMRRLALWNEHKLQGLVLARHIAIWVFLTYASCVSIAVKTNACNSKLDTDRLRIDLEIICGSTSFIPLQKLASRGSAMVAFFLPFGIFILLNRFKNDLDISMIRAALGSVFIGYKDTHWYWGIITMVEVEMTLACGAFRTNIYRGLSCLALITTIFGVEAYTRPDLEFGQHSLAQLRSFSGISLIMTSLLGVVMNVKNWELGMGLSEFDIVNDISNNAQVVAGFIALLHSAILFYGVFLAFYDTYGVPLKISHDSGGVHNYFAGAFLDAMKTVFGMNSIQLDTKTNALTHMVDDTVNVARLQDKEHIFLKYSMAEMLSKCVDSNEEVSTSLIGKTFAIALRRSEHFRIAMLRQHSDRTLGRHQLNEKRARQGVTCEEFFQATLDVGKDILGHHPEISGLSREIDNTHEGVLQDDGDIAFDSIAQPQKHTSLEDSQDGEPPAVPPIPVIDSGSVTDLIATSVQVMQMRDVHVGAYQIRFLKSQIRHADAEIAELRIKLSAQHKIAMRRAPQSDRHSDAFSSNAASSKMASVGADVWHTLDADHAHFNAVWDDAGHTSQRPTSLFSPRARGLSPGDDGVPMSFYLESDALNREALPTDTVQSGPVVTPSAVQEEQGSFAGSLLGRFGFGAFGASSASQAQAAKSPQPSQMDIRTSEQPVAGPNSIPATKEEPVSEGAFTALSQARFEERTEAFAAASATRSDEEKRSVALETAPAVENSDRSTAECSLKFQFSGKMERVAVGMFKTMLFAGVRKLGAADGTMHLLRFTMLPGSGGEDTFTVLLEGPEGAMLDLAGLGYAGFSVVGFAATRVEWRDTNLLA